ncbi:hypothetical protein [Oceanobacillus damuensis]|uniref:hypothetical protein n=1 Tax=Oceanobacillus damuensis TaxID=937928 RepID=UPI00082EA714|nr:hypothetical protein [Oceanobacillus damuensis]
MAVPENIEELAYEVRNAIHGSEVREAIASSMEATADVADWSRQVAQDIIDGKFDEGKLATEIENKLTQLEQDYAPNLTALETEVGDARGNKSSLVERLNSTDLELAQITKNEVLVIGFQNRVTDTNNLQSAIDNAPEGTKLRLTGKFYIERVYLKSHITFDLRKATILCESPSNWTINEADAYTRTFYMSAIENVEFIEGVFEGTGLADDRTTSIYGKDSTNIRFSGKQTFKRLSHGVQLQDCSRINGDTLLGDTLNGEYDVSLGLRAAVISAQGTTSVDIKSIQSYNSRKDVIYLGSTSSLNPCRDWSVGSIVSEVTYASKVESDPDWLGASNALHLRSVENLTIGTVVVNGGYTALDMQATTPDTTGDRVKNVKINNVVARNIIGRDPVILSSSNGDQSIVKNIEIGTIQLMDCEAVTSTNTANVYLNSVSKVKIGTIIGNNLLGNLYRTNNVIDVELETEIATGLYRNSSILAAYAFMARGGSKNVKVGTIFFDGLQVDGSNSLDTACDLSGASNVNIDYIKAKNALAGLSTINSASGIQVGEVIADDCDYIMMIRDNTLDLQVNSYHGAGTIIEEVRSGSAYVAPRENKISLVRKSRIIINPQWAGNPPSVGNFRQGDRWLVDKPTEGEAVEWVNMTDGTPSWFPVQVGSKRSVSGTPSFVGQTAVVSGIAYIATGTSSNADWKQITN